MTRVAVREVIEAGTWALRAAGVQPGDAPLAAQAAAMAEIANGTGVAALCDALERLATAGGGPGAPSVDGTVVSCPSDVGALLRLPRALMAVSNVSGLESLTITNATWHDGVLGALVANYRTTPQALVAVGRDQSGVCVGWVAVAADGIGYGSDAPPIEADDVVANNARVTVTRLDRELPGEASLSWHDFNGRHATACREGLFPDDEQWATLATRSYDYLVADNE